MTTRQKKSDAEMLRALERSQPEEIAKAARLQPGPAQGPTSIRFSDPLLKELDRLADQQNRSRSNLIQHILWEYIRKSPSAKKRA